MNDIWKMKNPFGFIAQVWQKTNLMFRIFSGIVVGSVLALLFPDWSVLPLLGTLFVGALKAIAPVLVAVLVMASVAKARMGLGARFRKVITLYMCTTLLAAILSVVACRLFPVEIVLSGVTGAENAAPGKLGDVFLNLLNNVVSNPVRAVVEANYLGILFWAVIIGLALKKTAHERTIHLMHDGAEAISMVVKWVIQCAPFGIMGLVYTTVSEEGLHIFTTYGNLLLLLVGCMLLVALVLNPIVIACLLRRNPYPLVFKCLKESGISGFFTRSSAANIPVNMNICKGMGLDEDFYSVSIPLGCTINMNGAAVTITVMTLSAAYTLGIDVSLFSALALSIIATLGACGASGVAGGSLLLIPMACSLFGIGDDIAMQVVALGFIIGVVQDSVETALNTSGDVIFTITAELHERMQKGEDISMYL